MAGVAFPSVPWHGTVVVPPSPLPKYRIEMFDSLTGAVIEDYGTTTVESVAFGIAERESRKYTGSRVVVTRGAGGPVWAFHRGRMTSRPPKSALRY